MISPTFAAAKGVLFREPLKPSAPLDAAMRVFPLLSQSVRIVLLKVARILSVPTATFFLGIRASARDDALEALPPFFIIRFLARGHCLVNKCKKIKSSQAYGVQSP